MNWVTIAATLLAPQIQRIETAQDLRELRFSLLADQALRTPRGVKVEWDEHPLWENEINDIDARLENLAAAASVESENKTLESIEYGIRTGQIAGGRQWFNDPESPDAHHTHGTACGLLCGHPNEEDL